MGRRRLRRRRRKKSRSERRLAGLPGCGLSVATELTNIPINSAKISVSAGCCLVTSRGALLRANQQPGNMQKYKHNDRANDRHLGGKYDRECRTTTDITEDTTNTTTKH